MMTFGSVLSMELFSCFSTENRIFYMCYNNVHLLLWCRHTVVLSWQEELCVLAVSPVGHDFSLYTS